MLEVIIWLIRFFTNYMYISVVTSAGELVSKRKDTLRGVRLRIIVLKYNNLIHFIYSHWSRHLPALFMCYFLIFINIKNLKFFKKFFQSTTVLPHSLYYTVSINKTNTNKQQIKNKDTKKRGKKL